MAPENLLALALDRIDPGHYFGEMLAKLDIDLDRAGRTGRRREQKAR